MAQRVVIVLAAARPGSLCEHLARVTREELEQAGAQVALHDLLEDGFDPVLRLGLQEAHARTPIAEEDALAARYAREVRECDRLVVVHPVWWFQAPAILKGWVDRILVHGVALEQQTAGPPRGLLQGKSMLVVQTFNSSASVDRLMFRAVSAFFWKRIVGLPTGLDKVTRLGLYGVESLAVEALDRFEERLARAVRALVR